jgi:hypothetical protein
MTSPLAICFSLVALSGLAGSPARLDGSEVSGCVRLIDSGHQSIRKGNDFSNIVVWLSPMHPTLPVRPLRKPARMLQKDKRFSPHVLVVPAGSSVEFPNLDPIFHNAFSNFEGQIFDVALYAPGSSRSVRFNRPGIVRVFCNIHPSMSAIIVVVNSDNFATTAADGSFVLPNVEPGSYTLHFFDELAASDTLERLDHAIDISDEALKLPTVVVSEAGYLPVAHKNKYGRDYPPNSEQSGSYGSLLK